MFVADMESIFKLSERVHKDYPEDNSVFDEKLRLFPYGCFTLEAQDSKIVGYCFSHPWTRGIPPDLDTLLEKLPATPTTYFIHDLALDDQWRGKGLAAAIMPVIQDVTRIFRLAHQTLVAVHRTEGFWRKFGFTATPDAALQSVVRQKYSDEATHMEACVDHHF